MCWRIFILTVCVLLSALCMSAQAGTATDSIFHREHLKILDIGNSYTKDATDLLPRIVRASGSDVGDMALWTLVRSGGSFKTWCDCYEDKDTRHYYLNNTLGGLEVGLEDTRCEEGDGSAMRDALTKVLWDVIIIHQVSTYAPYGNLWITDGEAGCLDKLLAIIRLHQPDAAIGFYVVHSTWGGYFQNTEKSSYLRWRLIANSVKELTESERIDVVIPYGTAIENLRQSSLNNEYDLTRDGLHLAYGLGQYTAACCYYEAVIAPRSGISVLGNTARVDCMGMASTYPAISVDDGNALTAQKAAVMAVKDWMTCRKPETEDMGVEAPPTDAKPGAATPCYDLQGRKINGRWSIVNGQWSMVNGRFRKGIYIRDGKKYN